MKVKEYCGGDFGGVTYKQGDFHTVGFSGGVGSVFDAIKASPNFTSTIKTLVSTPVVSSPIKPSITPTWSWSSTPPKPTGISPLSQSLIDNHRSKMNENNKTISEIQAAIGLFPVHTSAMNFQINALKENNASREKDIQTILFPPQTKTLLANTVTMKGMGGNFFENAFKSVFGAGASQVTSSLQAGATSVVTNVVGSKLTTDASAKQGIVDTVKASVGELYKEYKIPVIVIGGGISALLVYGIYNAVKKK